MHIAYVYTNLNGYEPQLFFLTSSSLSSMTSPDTNCCWICCSVLPLVSVRVACMATAPSRQMAAYSQNVPAGLMASSSGANVSVATNEVPQLMKIRKPLARFFTSGGRISPREDGRCYGYSFIYFEGYI